jgi:hypothetical protein
MDDLIPLEQRVGTSKIDTSFSFAEFIQPFHNLRLKYATLKTMDHYNRMEEQEKEQRKQDKAGTWKSPKDELKQVQSDFSTIQALKNKRRRLNDQEKK